MSHSGSRGYRLIRISARVAGLVALVIPACSGGAPSEPTRPPEVREEVKTAWVVAKKLLAHYGPDGLDRFDWRHPGAFEPLLKAGVLSADDGERIRRHGFIDFEFRRSVAFSRRYEFSFRVSPDEALMVELDHRGEALWGDEGEQDTSSDLEADVLTMWSVDKEGRSTQAAILAASRVFNTVKLVGMKRGQIVALVGDHSRRPNGKYNFPFWPASDSDLVYRFDNGAYGWQFNVVLNWRGTCTRVERHWIH